MQISFSIDKILEIVTYSSVKGEFTGQVNSIASLDLAKETDISFLGNAKYKKQVASTKAGIVLLPENYDLSEPANGQIYIFTKNPSFALAKICSVIEKILFARPSATIHPSAIISPTASIGKNVNIGAFCVIEDDAVISDNCHLASNVFVGKGAILDTDCYILQNVVIASYCKIGKRVRIQYGAVIGSDGYGYEFDGSSHQRVPQIGIVVLEDDVDVGANTTIDRARFSKTLIGKGTKIDNLVQIGHNVIVGENCLIVSQVGISGSTKLGNFVVLGGQTGIAGHLNIGDGVMLGGQSGVNCNIEPKQYMRGTPPMPVKDAFKIEILSRKLPQLFKQVSNIEKQLNEK